MAKSACKDEDVLKYEFKFEKGPAIETYFGDIIAARADVIVVPEGIGFQKPGYIGRQMLNTFPKFSKCREKLTSEGKNKLSLWDTYTSTLDGRFKHVIHAIVRPCGPGGNLKDWKNKMHLLYQRIFQEADRKIATVLAVPLLGTGRAGGIPEDAIEAAVVSVANFKQTSLKRVLFVSNDADIVCQIASRCQFELDNPGKSKKWRPIAGGSDITYSTKNVLDKQGSTKKTKAKRPPSAATGVPNYSSTEQRIEKKQTLSQNGKGMKPTVMNVERRMSSRSHRNHNPDENHYKTEYQRIERQPFSHDDVYSKHQAYDSSMYFKDQNHAPLHHSGVHHGRRHQRNEQGSVSQIPDSYPVEHFHQQCRARAEPRNYDNADIDHYDHTLVHHMDSCSITSTAFSKQTRRKETELNRANIASLNVTDISGHSPPVVSDSDGDGYENDSDSDDEFSQSGSINKPKSFGQERDVNSDSSTLTLMDKNSIDNLKDYSQQEHNPYSQDTRLKTTENSLKTVGRHHEVSIGKEKHELSDTSTLKIDPISHVDQRLTRNEAFNRSMTNQSENPEISGVFRRSDKEPEISKSNHNTTNPKHQNRRRSINADRGTYDSKSSLSYQHDTSAEHSSPEPIMESSRKIGHQKSEIENYDLKEMEKLLTTDPEINGGARRRHHLKKDTYKSLNLCYKHGTETEEIHDYPKSNTSNDYSKSVPKPLDRETSLSSPKESKADISEEICPICICEITDPKILDKCGHVFCRDCIDNSFKQFKPVCPNCNMVYGTITGNQPDGQMDVGFSGEHVPGYQGHGTITITYYFPSGVQSAEHPNPGQRYKGTTRRAYLPDNKEGNQVLKLLRTAFDRKLTFTIGRSTTTGQENVVTWNDIHHKTNIDGGPTRFGYPDQGYLRRVKDELASKGVTE